MRPVHIAMLAALTPLAACNNQVISQTPWFGPDAGADAPPLRPGLWRIDQTDGCAFDERLPLERWPECAGSEVVRRSQLLTLMRITEPGSKRVTGYDWSTKTYVLAAGDPRIEQLNVCSLGLQKKPADSAAAADATPAAVAGPIPVAVEPPSPANTPTATEEPASERFCYVAIRPTAWDASGRIIAFKTWPVVCGPYPAVEDLRSGKSSEDTVSRHPFPGLTITNDNCTAETLDALIGAARASEKLTGPLPARHQPFAAHWDHSQIRLSPLAAVGHWVRDTER